MWEYEMLEETNEKKLIERLNEYGKNNWEVCGHSFFPGAMGRGHHYIILKKQKG
jgi:hypothetical protein